MAKTQIPAKPMTPEQIESEIYGDGGLYDRVVVAMNKERTGIIARKLEISSQSLNLFKSYKRDGIYSEKPTFRIISKYAQKLGVE